MAINPSKLKKAKEFNRQDVLFCLDRVPGSQRLFCGSSDFKVYEVDLAAEKMEPKEMAGHESYVTGVAVAGGHVVSGAYDGRLIWWNAETREKVRTVEAHDRWIRNLVATPDAKHVISVADDMVARVWDAQSGKRIGELRGHAEKTPHNYPSMLYAVTVSADSKLVATGDKTGLVNIWDLASGKKLAEVKAPVLYTWDPRQRRHSIGGVRSLAFSPDAKLLAVGGIGQIGNIDHLGGPSRLEVFDWRAGKRMVEHEHNKLKGLFERLEFSSSGDWIVGAGGDNGGFVQVYDLKGKKTIAEEKAPMHVHSFALDEDSGTLYTVGYNRIVTWTMS